MVIGIDIDDTLIRTSKSANKRLGSYKKYNNIINYHDLNKEEQKYFLDKEIENITYDAKLFDDAKDVIDKLHEMGLKIIFITARNKDYEIILPVSALKLEMDSIYYDEVIFLKENKGLVAKQKGIDVFLDNTESVLDDIANYGIKTFKFDEDCKESMHEVVTSWQEFLNKILEMEDL